MHAIPSNLNRSTSAPQLRLVLPPARPDPDAPRNRLMACLIVGAIGFGFLDLCWTASAMSSVGMYESNPVARVVAGYGLAALIAFKILMMALHGGILWYCRAQRLARAAAWVSLFILLGLMTQWIGYFDAIRGLDPEALRAYGRLSSDWVEF